MSERETHFEIVTFSEVKGSAVNINQRMGIFMLYPVTAVSGFSWDGEAVEVSVKKDTRYEDTKAQEISSEDFFTVVTVGEIVSVHGRYSDQIFIAEKVSLIKRSSF